MSLIYLTLEFNFLLSVCMQEFGILGVILYHGTRFSTPAYRLELDDLATC